MSTGLFQDEEDGYNLEETNYKLKLDVPTDDSALPTSGNDDLGGFEDLGGEDDLGGLEDLGGEDGDKPFDDQPFDAGVEADETEDPEKFIQQLSGKLGTSLRKYSEERGQPDFDLEKFAVNSVISATHTAEMDDGDQKDIIAKVKGSGAEDDMGGEEAPNDLNLDTSEPVDGGDNGLEIGDTEDGELEEADGSADDGYFGKNLSDDEKEEEAEYNKSKEHYDAVFTESDVDEAAIRKPEEETKPNIHVYQQDPNAEKDINEGLKHENKRTIFVESVMPMIRREIAELKGGTEVKPAPTVEPTEKPLPKKKRVWRAKPDVNPKPKANIDEGGNKDLAFNGRFVEQGSIELEGVNPNDYPKFTDAFISKAYYNDGTELSEDERELFQNEYSSLILDMAYESLIP